jgi:hypothetical protein
VDLEVVVEADGQAHGQPLRDRRVAQLEHVLDLVVLVALAGDLAAPLRAIEPYVQLEAEGVVLVERGLDAGHFGTARGLRQTDGQQAGDGERETRLGTHQSSCGPGGAQVGRK